MTDLEKILIQRAVFNEQETGSFAVKIAGILKPQDVLVLKGTLGAGKTAFARALIRALVSANIDVPSPTFNLLLTYDSPSGPVFHYDFYRLEDPEEVWELDIEDAYDEGITLMEWAEKLEDLGPQNALTVDIAIPAGGEEGRREITLMGNDGWRKRLGGLAL
ncbi:MAG: tRNA (adenosine(37)-N6)-threonylcarbamoyltransferase complex ATPase subunit type 1 TsaE [Sneathiella sp.]